MSSYSDMGGPWLPGISICIVTKNSLFYNRLALMQIRKLTRAASYEILVFDNGSTDGSHEWLAEQPDVRLFSFGSAGGIRHGMALDYLVSEATREVICTLCSDAFPVSREWIVPGLWLNDEVYLTGAGKPGREPAVRYVCPSFLFGWTHWLLLNSFVDRWPERDTGEDIFLKVVGEGKKVRFVDMKPTDLGRKFKVEPPNDYGGLVWHSWYTTRKKVGCGEIDDDYPEYVQELLRKRYSLEF